ncbi:TonB-dependent receptor domain-containing protein [Psychroflexus sediminis]|uniref:Fe(3+) dicitrate transport protein n=1 Tax=Psychroflexus sediminis TaxID=470826 RepID=A0A1G7W5U7_9FLAO|nr:TonB-dependent receptor [Psychroflexus sediminis]SDG67362.1 Fe(3+) dicitrate transport protein [Psychroflexus sediminis]
MTLKDFSIVIVLVLFSVLGRAQTYTVEGYVYEKASQKPLKSVNVYDKEKGILAQTNALGYFEFETTKPELNLIFYGLQYEILERTIDPTETSSLKVELQALSEELSEVQIIAQKEKVFTLNRLKDVEGTAIYAGKKTEVIQVDQSMANLATNNARQIYSQVAGLNIFQNDDGGLQLNIGGRGLNPNRTANFNTRQNGYDISADVLGYPESYYTPASEGLQQIQIIRGAASLQYGTQFGGLVNFIMKEPNPYKTLEVVTRNTAGSFGLYTNFTSLSGTKGNWSYYTYMNYKRGDGFRPNSEYESINLFSHLGYEFNEKTKLTGEVTYMNYLAQQGGGLTDAMFSEDPYQSNRERNWFEVDWLLYNLKLEHEFSKQTQFTFNFFGLNAERNALGFRTNRVNQIDPDQERDLIVSDFSNFGFETRLLSEYKLFESDATFLIGAKYYDSDNQEQQGAGSDGFGPDFSFRNDEYPGYPNQSEFDLPNTNVAVFGENIFYLNDKFSVTPGFRFEYIKTESDGFFRRINTDAAGNVIDDRTIPDQRSFERSFVLLGLGLSYKPIDDIEMYANISENYRSVTFSDINISNPAFSVDPDITDEEGFTADLGLRGNFNNFLSYDASAFALAYRDRIGFVQKVLDDNRIISERGNVGDAMIYGVESLFDFNLKKIFSLGSSYSLNYFVNTSVINSEYTNSQRPGIEGNNVEFVPDLNLKTGARFAFKNFGASIQYSYLSDQFTDATNSVEAGLSGVIGEIPQYDVLDFSMSYRYKNFKLETGVNNLLDEAYFTRRATGYPGPGIIPSAPRNWYATLEIEF